MIAVFRKCAVILTAFSKFSGECMIIFTAPFSGCPTIKPEIKFYNKF